MVSEMEVRRRYEAYVLEVEYLDREIQRLQLRVRMGSDYWRVDMEQLANHAEHRRALEAQRQALAWVLMPSSRAMTSAAPHG
jgi:hypothetical protein